MQLRGENHGLPAAGCRCPEYFRFRANQPSNVNEVVEWTAELVFMAEK
jgi:hypothetical protein